MQTLIKRVHAALIRKRLTISLAESCTGGLLSYLLTSISGSSGYFKLGLIAYSNKAKEDVLRINKAILNKHGAVSGQTALAMAKAVRRIAKTSLGLSITGIAGPTGGSKIKPVGLVYIAIADSASASVWKFMFCGNREKVRRIAAQKALGLIQKWIA